MQKHIRMTALAALLLIPLALPAAERTKKKAAFAAADTDGDGKVSPSEYVAAMKGKLDESAAKARFADLDKDRNGSLSPEEFSTSTGEKKSRKKKDPATQ
jgi:Ca2+-binding EF-hand superfamily protein